MLILLTLLTKRTITAASISPLLQRPESESIAILKRLSAPPIELLETTRESRNSREPKFRLRDSAVAQLGPAVRYKRHTVDDDDRRIIEMVRANGSVNSKLARIVLGTDPSAVSRILASLVRKGLLVKTSEVQRGSNVTYGPGPNFPIKGKKNN